MRLHRLRLENFKGVRAREVTFPEAGVVVISGDNEVGKTSMIEALDLLLGFRHTSKHSKVKTAQPIGEDVGVTVEVEVTIGDERIVISRTWLKRPGTTVRFLTGPRRGEALAGDPACDVLDELWKASDTTLWSALRLMQATGLEQQLLSDSASLTRALQSAAGGELIDTEGSRCLLEAVKSEADRYFTATRQPNRDYKRVTDRVEQARSARQGALARLRELDGKRAELDQLTEKVAHRQQSLDKASAEYRELQDKVRTVEVAKDAETAAKYHLETAGHHADQAAAALTARTRLVDELGRGTAEVAELSAGQEQQRKVLEPIQQQLADAIAAHQAATASDQAADLALELAHADCEQLRRLAELDLLTDKLARADELRDTISRLEAAASSQLSAELIEQLDRADAYLTSCLAKLQVSSAQLVVTALNEGRELLVDGQPRQVDVAAPWHASVTEPVNLEVPGQWRIAVCPAQADELRAAAEQAGNRLDALLAVAGVDSARTARQEWTRLAELRTELDHVRKRRKELLAGANEADLRDKRSGLRTATDDYDATRSGAAARPADQPAADLALKLATEQRNRTRESCTQATAALQQVRDEHDAQKRLLDELTTGLVIAQRELEKVRSELADERGRISDDQLASAAREAEVARGEADQQWQLRRQQLVDLDADNVLAEAQAAKANVTGLEQMLADTREQRSRLAGELEGLNADRLQQQADAAQTEFEAATAEADSIGRRARAALLLEQVLQAEQELAQRSYVEPFRVAIAELGRALYGDPDFDVRVASDLQVIQRYLNGEWVHFDWLSTGAKEQLVILIRLATAQLVNPVDRVPVLLDDALGYSDQSRLRRMWTALRRAGEESQVIVLTANPERYAGMGQLSRIEL